MCRLGYWYRFAEQGNRVKHDFHSSQGHMLAEMLCYHLSLRFSMDAVKESFVLSANLWAGNSHQKVRSWRHHTDKKGEIDVQHLFPRLEQNPSNKRVALCSLNITLVTLWVLCCTMRYYVPTTSFFRGCFPGQKVAPSTKREFTANS